MDEMWSNNSRPIVWYLFLRLTNTVRYFDTFDWRLYRKGLALIQAGNAVYLQRISNGEYPLVRDQIEMKSCDLEGHFWWLFPEGELRDTLRDALSIRALLLRAQVTQKICGFGVLNADEKTVVRLFLTHTSTENGHVATLTLRSVRGYERDFENMCHRLDVAHVAEDVFERVMNLAGMRAGRLFFKAQSRPESRSEWARRRHVRF